MSLRLTLRFLGILALVFALVVKSGVVWQPENAQAAQPQNPKDVGMWSKKLYGYPLVPVAAANLPDGRVLMWSGLNQLDYDVRAAKDQKNVLDAKGKPVPDDKQSRTYMAILDPDKPNEDVTAQLITEALHNMFCPGTAMLADGRIMVVGGQNPQETSVFELSKTNGTTLGSGWSKNLGLNMVRGYNAAVTLFDGSVFTIGGTWNVKEADEELFLGGGKYGELWLPSRSKTLAGAAISKDTRTKEDRWIKLPGASSQPLRRQIREILQLNEPKAVPDSIQRDDDQHAFLIPSPDGSVLAAGPTPRMQWYHLSNHGSFESAGLRGDDVFSQTATVVTYQANDDGTTKVLKAGGGLMYVYGPANKNAYSIEMSGLRPTRVNVRKLQPMSHERRYANAVVLPDGQVLVIGGRENRPDKTSYDRELGDEGGVLEPELWNPKDGKWSKMESMQETRSYHSVALLLADGRVWSAGGGYCGESGYQYGEGSEKEFCNNNTHANGRFFSPPYFFKGRGPELKTAPEDVQSNSFPVEPNNVRTFGVTTDSEVARFTMIRLSSVTHSVNTDQRFIELKIQGKPTAGPGNFGYNLIAPSKYAAVPGYYFLFALNKFGVPSKAKIVMVNSP